MKTSVLSSCPLVFRVSLAVWASVASTQICHAQQLPRWELGLGLGGLSLPDYRGSDERRGYLLPLPYVAYRGDVIKADREGARAQIAGLEPFHLDFTLGASVPVSSSKNAARAGMPSLAAAIEIGPSLDATLFRSDDERVKLRLRLPVSYGITLDQPLGGSGWQTNPNLNVDITNLANVNRLSLGMRMGPIFATRHRNAYYYDVAPQYATATRPAYQAGAGYAGTQFAAALTKRFDRVWAGAFMRYDNLNGAVFVDSPLVKTRNYLSGGIGLAWVLGQSSEMVDID